LYLQYGKGKDIILIDGVSSSGKTTICKFYEKIGYYHIACDDFSDKAFNEMNGKLPNEYIKRHDFGIQVDNRLHELMYEESKKHQKFIFDDISQDIIKFFDRASIFIVEVHTSLLDIAKNIVSRSGTEPRGVFPFEQFAERYIISTKEDSIDKINRNEFINILKSHLKMHFESEDELLEFAKKIFETMKINDDDDHYIKLSSKFSYDYIIKTNNKSKEGIFEELHNLTK
jgi:RNase adaptor protein for sRNA GlmZ degradation